MHGKPFQLILMFVGKARSLPSRRAPERLFIRVGSSLTNRQGWKGFPGTNTLAYYKHSLITVVKSFITLAPGPNVMILFTAGIYKFSH
jgi:hypothetical protein